MILKRPLFCLFLLSPASWLSGQSESAAGSFFEKTDQLLEPSPQSIPLAAILNQLPDPAEWEAAAEKAAAWSTRADDGTVRAQRLLVEASLLVLVQAPAETRGELALRMKELAQSLPPLETPQGYAYSSWASRLENVARTLGKKDLSDEGHEEDFDSFLQQIEQSTETGSSDERIRNKAIAYFGDEASLEKALEGIGTSMEAYADFITAYQEIDPEANPDKAAELQNQYEAKMEKLTKSYADVMTLAEELDDAEILEYLMRASGVMESMNHYSGPNWMQIPPLLERYDRDQAKELIRLALREEVRWALPEQEATRQLILETFPGEIENLALPQWEIVEAFEDPEIFLIVFDRFGPAGGGHCFL